MNQYLELLRRRPAFRNLWLGACVSLAGDWFSLIALYGLLQEYTGSGEAIGLMLAARWGVAPQDHGRSGCSRARC